MRTELTLDDLKKISEKTGYKISTIRSILSGRRAVNNRNKVIIELGKKITDIKVNANKKINSL